MSQADFDAALDQRIRTMRIIIFALVNGVVIFMIIAILQRASGHFGEPRDTVLISSIALAVGVGLFVANLVVPNLVAAGARRQIARGQSPLVTPSPIPGDVGALVAVFQTRLILAAALLEGGSFFLLIAYLIEGQIYTLLGAIVLVVFLALRFPTRTGVERWLEEQQELLRQDRMSG
jgi:hypothetical protein